MSNAIIEKFREALAEQGLKPLEIVADGNLHRFDIDKNGDKAGWYVLHSDGVPAGTFGNWKDDSTHDWCAKKRLTKDEKSEHRQQIDEARKKRDAERLKMADEAKAIANRRWKQAMDAEDNHPYLQAKGVKAYGLRKEDGHLLVPVRIGGVLTSLQTIHPNGDKYFLSGGKVAGGYHHFTGDIPTTGRVIIVEGYATGATIHEATGFHVVVAFNAGNLLAAAKAMRSINQELSIVIAADSDRFAKCKADGCGQMVTVAVAECPHCHQPHKQINIGAEKARTAAAAVGGFVVSPSFADDEEGSDWNDWAKLYGMDAAKEAITKLIQNAERLRVPYGYSCGKDGVFATKDNGDAERITHRPVYVSALSRDGKSEGWGRLVHWEDHDNKKHQRPLPAKIFHGNCMELSGVLADEGLPIVPGKEQKLLQYLAAFTPEDRLTAAASTGWHGNAFVLPNRIINEPEGERIVYQPTEYRLMECFQTQGTLSDWQKMMEGASELMVFAVAMALAAPVRYLADVAAGGFHLYGQTSKGKTTVLQAASSVWGVGTDPSIGGGADVYLQRWNATKNGSEGMASAFNDLLLTIDEIGEGEEKEFGRIIYQLMSGTGKTRANRNGGMSKRRAWRVFILSSGELPVSSFMADAKGGQLVRMVDLEAINIFPDAAAADAMKIGCGKNYGHAGVAFLESGNLLEGWEAMTAERVGKTPTAESGRVCERFRLVAHAGELAIKRGILPWEQGAALKACQSIYQRWLASGVGMSDADRGVGNIRDYLSRYGNSRFEHEDGGRDPLERAGIFRSDGNGNNGFYHFYPSAFDEACGGVLPKIVKQEMCKIGILHTERGRLGNKIRIDGELTRVVSVSSKIFSQNGKSTGDSGDSGDRARGIRVSAVPTTQNPVGTGGDTDNDYRPSVPSVPSSVSLVGTAETLMGQGLSPLSPVSPVKNATPAKNNDMRRLTVNL